MYGDQTRTTALIRARPSGWLYCGHTVADIKANGLSKTFRKPQCASLRLAGLWLARQWAVGRFSKHYHMHSDDDGGDGDLVKSRLPWPYSSGLLFHLTLCGQQCS